MREGQIIGIVSNDNDHYFAELLIPEANFGKIKVGQKVLFKFPSFPSREYGSVEGVITNLKPIATDSGYVARAELVNGLTTTYKKRIRFFEGMHANVEIIAEKRRLFDRIVGRLRGLLD